MSSPDARYRFSSPIFEKHGNLPILPTPILRRILHFRLSLPPLIPKPVHEDDTEEEMDRWDDQAGNIGRRAWEKRVTMRKDVQQAACDLMLVCRAWRPIAQEYLYSEPHIKYNFPGFVKSITNGEKKWSDLRLRPISTPGRYVRSLDLSQVLEGFEPLLREELYDLCRGHLFPLIPNLTYLRLPRAVRLAEFKLNYGGYCQKIRALEGVCHESDQEDHIVYTDLWAVTELDNLESVSVYGNYGHNRIYPEEDTPKGSSFGKDIHTLKIHSGDVRLMIELLRTSSLPKLTVLHVRMDQYDTGRAIWAERRCTIISLTLTHAGIDRLADFIMINREVLTDFPDLLHLSLLVPSGVIPNDLVSSSLTRHPLRSLTLSKWSSTPKDTIDAEETLLFIDTLFDTPPRSLQVIRIDNYKWVKSVLGQRAMETGDSGNMRHWSRLFATKGIQLRDMEGNTAPPLPRGRNGSFGANGTDHVALGRENKRKASLQMTISDGDGDGDEG